jgi:putative ABC transport system permease protein
MLVAGDHKNVLLDASWAGQHNLGINSKISLFTASGPEDYVVKGLVNNSSFIQDGYGQVVFVTLDEAQQAFQLGAKVTQVSVGFKYQACSDANCPDNVFNKFRNNLKKVAIDDYSLRNNQTLVALQKDPFGEIEPLLLFFGMVPLLTGLLLIYNNMTVSIVERRRDIGLLRAAGATTGWVRNLFVYEFLILGIIGSIFGVLLGALAANLMVNYLRAELVQPGISLLMDPIDIVEAFTLGLATTVMSSLIPASQASRLPPLRALRPQNIFTGELVQKRVTVVAVLELLIAIPLLFSPATQGFSQSALFMMGIGVLLLFVGTLALIPSLLGVLTSLWSKVLTPFIQGEAELAKNAILRRPSRSAPTIAGLAISSMLVVGVTGLSQGASLAGSRWVSGLFVSDQLMVSPVRQSEDLRQQIQQENGIASTSEISLFTTKSGNVALNVAAIDPMKYSQKTQFKFVSGDPKTAIAEIGTERAVLVPLRISSARKWKTGDVIDLETGTVLTSYKIAGIVEHTIPAIGSGETMMISLQNAKLDFGVTGFNILQIIPATNTPANFNTQLQLEAQKYGMQYETVQDIQSGVQKGLGGLLLFLTASGLVGVLLGLLAVINTIYLNISESRREFGLLRAVGMTRGQIKRMIFAQSFMLGASGALIGCLVGLGLIWILVQDSTTISFEPIYVIPWGIIAGLWIVLVGGSLLAGVIPARKASQESIISSLRYE